MKKQKYDLENKIENIVKKITEHYSLEDLKFRERKLREFEDIYNPLKIHAYLRKGLNIPRAKAEELSRWYEDVFYKQVMDEYKRIKKE